MNLKIIAVKWQVFVNYVGSISLWNLIICSEWSNTYPMDPNCIKSNIKHYMYQVSTCNEIFVCFSFTQYLKSYVALDHQFSSLQSLSRVWLFVTPWTAACQASLYFTNSQSLLKLMCSESVIPPNHLILYCPLLLLPFPIIRVFTKESVLRIRWPEYWSFSFGISPSSEYSGLISCRMDWLDLLN